MRIFRCVAFGCRVNQYEAQAVREQLLARGYAEAEEGERPNWVVINSCTVTGAADRECVSLIRSLRQVDPAVRVAVTGCLVQRDSGTLKELPGVALLVGTGQKHRVGDLIEEIDRNQKPVPGTALDSDVRLELEMSKVYSPLAVSSFPGMQKAFVKVQDGCDRACAFCKIPYVRGRSRSRDLEETLREVRRLVDAGCREIILTGVAIGLWGREQGASSTLAELVEALDALEGRFRVRLSSLDPRDLDDPLIETLGCSKKVCHHLHLSLQSGSDPVLERMRRGYTTGEYRERVSRVRRRWPDLGLTTDLIAGFPGETERMFEETLGFCREMGFARVHVFPYSPRRGTSASGFRGRLEPGEVRHRARELRRVAGEVAAAFRRGLEGTVQEVLIEQEPHIEERGRSRGGYTGQFIWVRLPEAGDPLVGSLARVRLLPSTGEGGLVGQIFPVTTLTNWHTISHS